MTVLADARTLGDRTVNPGPTARSAFERPGVAICIGVMLTLALTWPRLVAVWQTGAFFDTDDAMHMVQVRDWLAGQGWFDLTAHRLDPPIGVAMHWTRILDVPLAILIQFFRLFVSPEPAERLARIAYPVLAQFALFVALASLARRLAGPGSVIVACVLAPFAFALAAEFAPGRITHHSAQILLLLVMMGATMDALQVRHARSALLAGGLAALSLAITIENLPFIAAMIGVLCTAWIIRGQAMARPLALLGSALAAGTLCAFLATVPPARYFMPTFDALSCVQLIAAVAGGLGLVLLAWATPILSRAKPRLLAAVFSGVMVFAGMGFAFPGSLNDPHAAVDPLVRDVWLSHVYQAIPLWRLLAEHPLAALQVAVPLALGLIAAVVAAVRETGDARARWLTLTVFIAAGICGALWQLRVAHSVAPIAILGSLWVLKVSWSRAVRVSPLLAAGPVLLASLFTSLPWALAASPAPPSTNFGDAQACFAPASFAFLNRLPPGLVLAPIDAGPYILAYTRHSVVAGPYHRNNHGDRLAIRIMLAGADAAQDLLHGSGARYVAVCPAADELNIYAGLAPGGFAQQLRAGNTPDWLQRLSDAKAAYVVYAVR